MNKEVRYLFTFIKPYWYLMLLLLFLIICSTVTALATPYFLKLILDNIIPDKNYELLIKIIFILVIVYLFRMSIGLISDYLTSILQNKIIGSIKSKLFANLLYLPFSYFEINKPGDIIQKISHEVDKIQSFLSFSVIRLINNVFTLISLIVMLCWLDTTLFFLTISVAPVSIIINRSLAKKIKRYVRESSEKEGDLFSFYFDRVRNIKLIKVFFTYSSENDKFSSKLGDLLNIYKNTTLLNSFGRNLVTFFISLGPLIVFSYGGYQVIQGGLTIGALVAYIQYMNRIYGPANDLSGLYVDYVRIRESAIRIFPILSANPLVENYNGNRSVRINSIYINQLSHTYDNRKKVLENFSFEFKKGRKYVIVGTNGCGKTTLIKYFCKLYKANDNVILINKNEDLNNISDQEWSKKMTVISQELSILYDTLRNNLLYGNLQADDELLESSIKNVGLRDFFDNLSQKLDTKIGDGNDCVNPSGGQSQMLALARVFLSKKEIVILDESTSSIDAENEIELLDRIIEYCQDSILISVSHKLNYILQFDEVLFLDDGKIIENGDPKDLITKKGVFYKLFKTQLDNNLFNE